MNVHNNHAEIAQQVEQRTRNAQVSGSIPLFGIIIASIMK